MSLKDRKLAPCKDCYADEEDRVQDWKVATGHHSSHFAEAKDLAKQLTSTYGCDFFVEQPYPDSDWKVTVWAGCLYSILQQIDTRIEYDHVNHFHHYVGNEPVVGANGCPLPEAIERASALANEQPGCVVVLSLTDDDRGWLVVRSMNSDELYSARIERAQREFDEAVEYIEAGAYDKSIGASRAMENASRQYRRALAMAKGGEEAKAWGEMDRLTKREDGFSEDDDDDDEIG